MNMLLVLYQGARIRVGFCDKQARADKSSSVDFNSWLFFRSPTHLGMQVYATPLYGVDRWITKLIRRRTILSQI